MTEQDMWKAYVYRKESLENRVQKLKDLSAPPVIIEHSEFLLEMTWEEFKRFDTDEELQEKYWDIAIHI
jgi:hypothetical protein